MSAIGTARPIELDWSWLDRFGRFLISFLLIALSEVSALPFETFPVEASPTVSIQDFNWLLERSRVAYLKTPIYNPRWREIIWHQREYGLVEVPQIEMWFSQDPNSFPSPKALERCRLPLCGFSNLRTLRQAKYLSALFAYKIGPANAFHRGGSASVTPGCPYPEPALPDGCVGANGTQIQTALYTGYANQSGQASYTVRPNFNVGWVDYAIGIPVGTVLKDPAAGGLPSGCTYSATGSPQGAPQVSCSATTNLTFQGWEMDAVGGHACTLGPLVNAGTTGTILIDSNEWGGCTQNSAQGMMGVLVGSSADVTFSNNTANMHADTGLTTGGGMGLLTHGTITITRSYFTNMPDRVFGAGNTNRASGTTQGDLIFEYNGVNGLDYVAGVHGEVGTFTPSEFIASTVAHEDYLFDVILTTSTQAPGAMTTLVYLATTAAVQPTITSTRADYMTLIGNKNGSVGAAQAGIYVGGGRYTTIETTNNFYDQTGFAAAAFECQAHNPQIVGSIDGTTGILTVTTLNSTIGLTTNGIYNVAWSGGPFSGVMVGAQQSAALGVKRSILNGATVSGTAISAASLSGISPPPHAGDFADDGGVNVTNPTTFLSWSGLSGTLSRSLTISTPQVINDFIPTGKGTYATTGWAPSSNVTSQNMYVYVPFDGDVPNGMGFSGNINLITGASSSGYFMNGCVFGPTYF